jgi:hypothetical protein
VHFDESPFSHQLPCFGNPVFSAEYISAPLKSAWYIK